MDDGLNFNYKKKSYHRIYYLFSFLMVWYGIAWYLFPKIMENITELEDSAGIIYSTNFSIAMMIVFITIGLILFVIGLTKD